jgi:hypothetical protein
VEGDLAKYFAKIQKRFNKMKKSHEEKLKEMF